MKRLDGFLDRFYKSLLGGEQTKDAIISEVFETCGVKISKKKIYFKEGKLDIDANPAAKNQIKLKEEALIKSLLNKYGIKVVRILYR